MKNRTLFNLSISLVFTLILSISLQAQETTVKKTTTTTTKETKVVDNGDGTYTVIEYPMDKEVMVDLRPTSMQGAKGSARVMRMNNETKVHLDLSGITGDAVDYYVYAVNPAGTPTLLGPVTIEDGAATADFSTPMNQFMLVLSPMEELTTINADSEVVFRSALPKGQAVVPLTDRTGDADPNNNEKLKAVSNEVASTYDVPLLNVPSFKNKTTEIKIKFSGELQGLKGKAYIEPHAKRPTEIKMRFDDMKMAPKEKRYVLWAVSPEGEYTKLGQVINNGNRQESEIRSETALKDFGLLVTIEDSEVNQPTSRIYSIFGRQ